MRKREQIKHLANLAKNQHLIIKEQKARIHDLEIALKQVGEDACRLNNRLDQVDQFLSDANNARVAAAFDSAMSLGLFEGVVLHINGEDCPPNPAVNPHPLGIHGVAAWGRNAGWRIADGQDVLEEIHVRTDANFDLSETSIEAMHERFSTLLGDPERQR